VSAKRFFYLAAGVFLLAAAYHLGARDAAATYVDHTAGTGPVIAASYSGSLLRSDGQAWYYRTTTHEWVPIDWQSPLPVPLSELAFWGEIWFVTREGEFWQMDTSLPGPPYPWVSRGRIPSPEPIGATQKSWAGVKDGYRR